MSQSVKCNSCGEQSTEHDFCSHCGVQIESATPGVAGGSVPIVGIPGASSAAAAPSGGHDHCPKCTAERDDPTGQFCGTCGYNFVTGQGGDIIQPEPAPVVASPATAPSTVPPAAANVGPRMDVVITVNFNAPSAPKVRPSLTFPLYDEESLIGRKNSSVSQALAIEDDAVSKRHAMIVRLADGSFVIRDLNSTNGTKVNGVDVTPGADHPLKEGDVITMGEFTIITVQAIRKA